MKEIKKGTQVLVIDSDEVYFSEISHFDGNFYGLAQRNSVPKEMVHVISDDSLDHAVQKIEHMIAQDKEKVNAARRRMRRHQKILEELREKK